MNNVLPLEHLINLTTMNRKQFLATIIGLPAAIKAVLKQRHLKDSDIVTQKIYVGKPVQHIVGGKPKWPCQDEIYPGIPYESFHVKLDKDWLLEGRIVGKRSTIALNELLDKFVKGQ